MNLSAIKAALRQFGLALLLALPIAAAAAADQKTFASPEAAVQALVAALKANDQAALVSIFGNEHKDAVGTGDPAYDGKWRADIAARIAEFLVIDARGDNRRVLLIGDLAWPVPIPLVREAGAWRFATEEGVDEIVNRRIGGNERNAIFVMRAFLDAQREYGSVDRDGDGVRQYATKLLSSPGKQDGLYWPTDAAKGEESSPFGPLIGASSINPARKQGEPYRGYHFRILTRQGKAAPGGAYSYVINGRMIAGIALVAYPAAYGQSGIMSFIVNHNGKVYEKDLGKNSTSIGAAMTTFDPGAGWKEVDPGQ